MNNQVLACKVSKEWVDYNGHMNDAAYAKVFSMAVDALMGKIGLDSDSIDKLSYTIYTLETHLCYLKEAHEGQDLNVEVHLLDRDAKRLHVFFTMKNDNDEAIATSEQMLMGIGTVEGRPAPFPESVSDNVQKLEDMSAGHEIPQQAGRTICIRKK
ncbi:thioesterase family protein [Sediminibacillus massiliensis]|uniref:thioesterase family protein n=1 Tax=Sediminibacillus massiliensis TaxID=1926277 RepID=UPI000988718B|nr:thioesterase family protein [Sediminibacillus massiliensis]